MNNTNTVDLKSAQLCLACGVCCQGILGYHDLVPEKFSISPEPRNPLLPLACLLFREKENRCLIHEHPRRPSLCQTFQCQLLQRFLRNEITIEQARSKIKSIKALLTKILTQIPQNAPPTPLFMLIQSVSDSIQLELDSGDRSNIDLFMDINWLGLLISRHIIPTSA